MKMEYYKNLQTGDIYSYDEEQIAAGFVAAGLVKMTGAEIELHLNPPLTPEQLTALREDERQLKIDAANDFMNGKQWPGKAAIGRLKGTELDKYNLWLDYLDDLYAVDASGEEDIDWPTSPDK